MLANKINTVQLVDLWLGYTPGNYLIESVNADVHEGEMIALVGRNGTGKSTLLRTIAGIQSAVRGGVTINNLPVEGYKQSEFSALVSFVGTARTITENMSVFEMVSLGRHPYTNWWGVLTQGDKQKIIESIRFVGMEDFNDAKVERLSDGERQRVMIAMALAQDTSIIILDEPTAFLDIPNRLGIAEVLYKLRLKGKTVIFSTHDFDTAFSYADKFWVIHKNTLIQGAPEDLGIEETFEDIFKDSEVIFDADNLRFKRIIPSGKTICIQHSEKIIYTWTCRAMERIGYSVSNSNSTSYPEIIITENAGTVTWLLKEKDTSSQFNSLYEITRFLT